MNSFLLHDSSDREDCEASSQAERQERSPKPEDTQRAFLAILPRLKEHGRVYFRDLKHPDRRGEAISEMIAIAWLWFVRLVGQGRDPSKFPSVLATYAARSVRSGRRLCGQEKARDVLSPLAQQRRGFSVNPLPETHDETGKLLDEALQDNSLTPVIDQVQFRLDFPRWRGSRCERDRRLIDDLMIGERTKDMAQKYGLSSTRVSELRGQFFTDWTNFCENGPRLAGASA
jgi:hypothetical protein